MAYGVCPHYNESCQGCKLHGNSKQGDHQRDTYCMTSENWLKCLNYQPLINSAGLSVDSVTYEHHPTAPDGNVIASSPAFGSSVKQGTTVALRLSKGTEMVTDWYYKWNPRANQGDWTWKELCNVTFGFAGLCLIPFALFTAEQPISFIPSVFFGGCLIFLSGILSSDSKKNSAVIAAIFVIVEFLLVSFALFSARVIFKEMSLVWQIAAISALGALPIIFLAGFLGGLSSYRYKGKTLSLSLISSFVTSLGFTGALSLFLFFFVPSNYNHRMGHAYYSNGDYDRAIANYNKAIRFAPDKALFYYNRGGAYLLKRDYDSCIADFTQAIKLAPDNNSIKERITRLKQLVQQARPTPPDDPFICVFNPSGRKEKKSK